ATSNAAILTVVNGPSVTSQPVNSTVCEGANTSFTVGGSAGASYQWQLSTDAGLNYNNITGATSATLNLAAVTFSMNNYYYRCVLTTAGCSVPALSNAAILTVNRLAAITFQPTDATICSGSSHTFCVTAVGTNLVYAWEYSIPGCPGPWLNVVNNANFSGASTACLTITNFPLTAAFRCIVMSAACGNIVFSNCATLTVINPVTITSQPSNAQLCSGSNTSFSVTATGVNINYQWQVNTGTGFTNIVNNTVYSGATTSTLTITGATAGMNGYQYRSNLSNAICTTPIPTNTVLLTVRQLPSVTLSASPLTGLLPGQTTTLTATPSPSTGGTLTTNWFFNAGPISNTGNTRVVNIEQVGDYLVTIQETFAGGLVCSNQSSVVKISATPSPKLFIFPSPNDGTFKVAYYNDGGTSTKRSIAIFDSKGSKVYDRLFDISGAYTLIGIDLRTANTGIYYVVVGDINGKKLATGKVHVR
ncbi:MAG TPA: hypothetical protein VK483_00490, partial [Chitinophagaceae bacterium]|nr:hypothetical protein [Chitinophagaceae bacterium]